MSIACGPYTSDSDLKYEPWYTLVANLKSMRPDIVVLVGSNLLSGTKCTPNVFLLNALYPDWTIRRCSAPKDQERRH
jgi:hypothetical protein